MRIVVSNCSVGKPHPHAVLKQVGVGHKEWFVDSCNYSDAYDLAMGREMQVTYDTFYLTFRVHFLDEKDFAGVSISTLDRYYDDSSFSTFLNGHAEKIKEAAEWLGMDSERFAKAAVRNYLSEIQAAMRFEYEDASQVRIRSICQR